MSELRERIARTIYAAADYYFMLSNDRTRWILMHIALTVNGKPAFRRRTQRWLEWLRESYDFSHAGFRVDNLKPLRREWIYWLWLSQADYRAAEYERAGLAAIDQTVLPPMPSAAILFEIERATLKGTCDE